MLYRLSVQTISRGAGRSVIAAAAYRAATRLTDPRTGLTHDYRAKRAVGDSGLVGWTGDRESLWATAMNAERHPRAVEAREVLLALPRGLDREQHRILVVGFAEYLMGRHGVAVDWSVHCPLASDGGEQPHAHLLLTSRRIGPAGRPGPKTRELDTRPSGPQEIEAWRAEWAAQVNRALEAAGLDDRVDHRSAKRRGLADDEPQERLGPAAAALERRGVRTAAGDRNRRRRRRNRRRAELTSEAAATNSAIAVCEREQSPQDAIAAVDRAIGDLPNRPAAMADLWEAASGWDDQAARIVASRVRRAGRDAVRQVTGACRVSGVQWARALLDELTEAQDPRQRQR